MKTMTLDDLIQKPLTEEDKRIINSAKPVITEDCPELTDEQMKKFKPWYEVHPKGNDIYKVTVKKTAVSLRIDNDVLAALKNMGKGYQTRINNILRKAVSFQGVLQTPRFLQHHKARLLPKHLLQRELEFLSQSQTKLLQTR